MNEIKQLTKVSRFLQYLAYFLFMFIWGEIFFIFSNHTSPGQLLYNEYGENGISLYLGFTIVLAILLSAQSKKINDVIRKLENDK